MSDLTPCEHQVGGWHNGTQSLVLKDKKEGLVVKPVKLHANPTHDPTFDPSHYTPHTHTNEQELIPVCRNELEFYEFLQTSTDPQDVSLKALLPLYHGSRLITTDEAKVTPHLLLGDLARGMKKPCVADIKMGRSFTYPGKDFTKKINKKYATRDELGYCLSGLRVFDPDTGALVVELRPDACKQLDRSQVFHSLEMFCQRGHPASRHLRDSVVSQLRQIHQWFMSQKKYWVRCSSILVIYDAATLTTTHTDSQVLPDTPVPLTTRHIGSEVLPDAPVTVTTQHSDSKVLPDTPVPLTTKHSASKVITDPPVTLPTQHSSSEVIPEKEACADSVGVKVIPEKEACFDSVGVKVIPEKEACADSVGVKVIPEKDACIDCVSVKVKMIDFAHVLYSFGHRDDNYIFGLEKLVEFFNAPDSESNSE
ncbi:hypothetical protein Pmani_035018 [Petrolisthes manimaculis]|uniref:Kinase n=1 Tax=Petrolisthes manimaculis TaxID=1843537 RepID=A0AAE1NN57_9EUCA|nr:hypothetical protein Pmani_035018 [Petrolisthes manimaculis]